MNKGAEGRINFIFDYIPPGDLAESLIAGNPALRD